MPGLNCEGLCLNDTDNDGVCDENEVTGCTDDAACNYNPAATDNDNSCTYPNNYYDCADNCINDADNDGVCDENEVMGCTNTNACNYDATATENDNSCLFSGAACDDNLPGTINDIINEGCECVGEIVGDTVYGCIDISACNFDIAANYADGSCEYALPNYDCDGNCIYDTDNDG
ncbi:MAG: hypothetical protein ACKOW8_13000, partial [Flavobacteriales bacterium]